MKLLETMLSRRSIRQYTEEAIPEEKLNMILQAGLLAPTSRNIKPCEFYVIRNKDILMKLSQAKAMGAFMMLMAEEQEIGSCWCQIHLRSSAEGKDAEETVRDILGIDSHMRIVGILALGKPEKRNPAHALDELNWDKVHYI